ncbi:unnamed protein product [Fusarium graminearum]|uniref:Chromosome 4, complete genome n=1 Tax=Gibberella zeae (strain ATCC MYA-4620 / CBS 123657 / FGSC 9075 / NRRL 31084 / PH-1) TaxID=229533 RepID=A0A098DRD8_GIBZE|nr:unnamed protein product [Fusarium graminearum]
MDRSSQDIDLESLGSIDSAHHQPVPERTVSRTDTNTDEAALEEFEPSILERAVDSIWGKFSSSDGSDQVPHPDRGWRSWCSILSCHLIFMNTCGWVNSSGAFQMYYTENTSLPAGNISWIGSIGACFLFFFGALTSCLVYANTVCWIFSIGIILQFFGLILTSVCREYWQYILAQGVLIGLGHGLIFCPALAVLSTDFATRRPLEIGEAGHLDPRADTGQTQTLYSRTAFNVPLSSEKSLQLLVIFNGTGIVGYFATFVTGRAYWIINILTLVTLAASLFLYFWIAVQNSVGLCTESFVYGRVVVHRGSGQARVRASMTFMVASIAALTGPPIADAIIELQGSYMGAQVFGGSVTLLGFAILVAARIMWMKRTSVGWLEKNLSIHGF